MSSRMFIRDGWRQLWRFLVPFVFLSLLFSSRAMASNPQDLGFQLRLVKETPAYHRGESILLEVSYSTSSKDKYQASTNSALQGMATHIVPSDGVLDLNVLRFEHGFAGSIIGGMGVLSSQPKTRQIDLCSLYRFKNPGHYSVGITSNEVSRIKSAEEGGGLENLTLGSNWVDFDILPSDPAWDDAEVSYRTKPLSPDILSELRFNVLAAENELTHAQRLQFVVIARQTMAHQLLLPIIRSLASDSGTAGASFDSIEPYKLWCEDAPEECHSAILADIQRSQFSTNKNVTLLLEEGEHTELDSPLKEQLSDLKARQDWAQSERLAAVIVRAASHNLAVPVKAWLTELTGKPGCAADVEDSLLGYLLRLGDPTAGKRLSSELWDRKDGCGGQLLRSLHAVRNSDELLPLVSQVLKSPNPITVTQAALFLGEHGSPSSEDLLWQRLESLWTAWHDRASELQVAAMNFSASAN